MANWDKIENSGDVDDRRGNAAAVGVGSIGTLVVVGVLMLLGGVDPNQIVSILGDVQSQQPVASQGVFEDTKNYKGFAQKLLGSNNSIWTKELAKSGIQYPAPKLVLFRGGTESACGGASSAVGPHYCPSDQTVYLDETFFEELTSKFGAKGGDVAEAYVIAHEIGHHIQNVKGTFDRVNQRDNRVSVRIELQADCYAGVWAGDVQSEGIITEQEIDQAIDAAGAVGDDRIQKSQTGRVNPESWTHGSSAQRKQWFMTGYRAKDSSACNTI
jgi:uncharacterized protein